MSTRGTSPERQRGCSAIRKDFFSSPFVSWHEPCFSGSNLDTVSFSEPLGSPATAWMSSLQLALGLSWQGTWSLSGKGWSYLRKALGFVKSERFSTSSQDGGRGRGCYDTSGWRTPCPSCDLYQQILSRGGFRWPWGLDTLLMLSCFLLSLSGKKHSAASKRSQDVDVFLDHPSIFHGVKNVNAAALGSGSPAVAANPSEVWGPTDVFTWRSLDVLHAIWVLDSEPALNSRSFARVPDDPFQHAFKGHLAVLILGLGRLTCPKEVTCPPGHR